MDDDFERLVTEVKRLADSVERTQRSLRSICETLGASRDLGGGDNDALPWLNEIPARLLANAPMPNMKGVGNVVREIGDRLYDGLSDLRVVKARIDQIYNSRPASADLAERMRRHNDDEERR